MGLASSTGTTITGDTSCSLVTVTGPYTKVITHIQVDIVPSWDKSRNIFSQIHGFVERANKVTYSSGGGYIFSSMSGFIGRMGSWTSIARRSSCQL